MCEFQNLWIGSDNSSTKIHNEMRIKLYWKNDYTKKLFILLIRKFTVNKLKTFNLSYSVSQKNQLLLNEILSCS